MSSFVNTSTLYPNTLCAADLSSSSGTLLSDLLGLSPPTAASSGHSGAVKTYQCGEFKYPDVSSSLNKILSKSHEEDSGNDSSLLTTSSTPSSLSRDYQHSSIQSKGESSKCLVRCSVGSTVSSLEEVGHGVCNYSTHKASSANFVGESSTASLLCNGVSESDRPSLDDVFLMGSRSTTRIETSSSKGSSASNSPLGNAMVTTENDVCASDLGHLHRTKDFIRSTRSNSPDSDLGYGTSFGSSDSTGKDASKTFNNSSNVIPVAATTTNITTATSSTSNSGNSSNNDSKQGDGSDGKAGLKGSCSTGPGVDMDGLNELLRALSVQNGMRAAAAAAACASSVGPLQYQQGLNTNTPSTSLHMQQQSSSQQQQQSLAKVSRVNENNSFIGNGPLHHHQQNCFYDENLSAFSGGSSFHEISAGRVLTTTTTTTPPTSLPLLSMEDYGYYSGNFGGPSSHSRSSNTTTSFHHRQQQMYKHQGDVVDPVVIQAVRQQLQQQEKRQQANSIWQDINHTFSASGGPSTAAPPNGNLDFNYSMDKFEGSPRPICHSSESISSPVDVFRLRGGNGDGNAISLERAARFHRNSAALYDATFTWSGQLPSRNHHNSSFSCKVFLGGVPWDITEASLLAVFKPFGNVRIEWPGKDNASIPKGYLYIIFEHEKQVKALLTACTHDFGGGGSWYFKVSSRRMRNKEVQVIPWVVADSSHVRCQSQRLDPQKTVFVGALHGMLNAEGLCNIFDDLFGSVLYAGIDTDKYKYPIGSARVTFNNHKSYMKAVAAAFIEIKTTKFTKKVQVDPYLEDALCCSCGIRQGPYFCRDLTCFRYFCRCCWELRHVYDFMSHHKPLMRNCKQSTIGGNNPGGVRPASLLLYD